MLKRLKNPKSDYGVNKKKYQKRIAQKKLSTIQMKNQNKIAPKKFRGIKRKFSKKIVQNN